MTTIARQQQNKTIREITPVTTKMHTQKLRKMNREMLFCDDSNRARISNRIAKSKIQSTAFVHFYVTIEINLIVWILFAAQQWIRTRLFDLFICLYVLRSKTTRIRFQCVCASVSLLELLSGSWLCKFWSLCTWKLEIEFSLSLFSRLVNWFWLARQN